MSQDSKPHISLDTEELKRFPPDGCDHYAWLHYVLPLVEQLEAAQKALRWYAELGPDDIPYMDSINDPPDVGRTAREALNPASCPPEPSPVNIRGESGESSPASESPREPDYSVFYKWCVENAPRVVALCPYKFPGYEALALYPAKSPQ